MKKTGYFFDALLLEPGFVINPGRWGGTIMKYIYPFVDMQSAHIAFRENVLEYVRSNCDCCKNKPSRLGSAFCCPSLESAEAFKAARPNEYLHLVEYDNNFPMFLGSWNAVSPASTTTVAGMYQAAYQYWHTDWSAGAQKHLEIVTLSPLTILSQIF